MATVLPAPPPPTPKPEHPPLDVVKDYLRVTDNVENDKIQGMIPRARLWVEAHTGIAVIQRQFVELHSPRAGAVWLYRGPLVSVDSVAYVDGADDDQLFEPIANPPSTKLSGDWPSTAQGVPFTVTYTAGLAPYPPEGEDIDYSLIDDRLTGAMLALIEGEYSAGYAYPDDAITSATNCLFYMKFVAP